MAAAKGEGEIFLREAEEIFISAFLGGFKQGVIIELAGEGGEKILVVRGDFLVAGVDEGDKIGGGQGVVTGEYAAVHVVEEHVGEVVDAGDGIGSGLQSIGRGNVAAQAGVAGGDAVGDEIVEVWLVDYRGEERFNLQLAAFTSAMSCQVIVSVGFS